MTQPANAATMKAAWIDRYGPPEVITVRETAMPVMGPRDVLIRMRASTVTLPDCAFRAADPFIVRFFAGLLRPKAPIPGGAVAGEIAAVGEDVIRFAPGDRVFGTTDPNPSAMAQYVAMPEDAPLAIMPDALDFGEAAGLTYSFLTAMPFLRDEARLQPGQSILINGAAGSIGTVAVQLARHMGAHVTAVCSARNADLVSSLGADAIIDRHTSDFTRASAAYDVIFDVVGKSSYLACKKALKPRGIYLTTTPSFAILWAMIRGKDAQARRGKLATTGLRPLPDKAKDMLVLRDLVAKGKLHGVIDRVMPLEAIAEAHRYVEQETKAGDVIIEMPR
ncbi:NAD(P)-dependent alcohol dehydrogenase [Pelagibacterium halotolerans]|uniref:Zinc-containing alcohol dehydrogenase superfamily n=1 Tax=Pelagibacterium halotolerans (strain DSM 22347 / JCM 15775 / CGMCC 1.7692 / B2) TaxID=1082931 RepID=G4RG32_PELHB|nr:NAD(P)-dependent alcohol dehydrogenase [Pelagibacterium halotolerans]AEQ52046.1 zinc-containing alcohol dehydrogenase superfamily [Pelagibacterium halotolerans B2]QJR18176.1 NAD(P)-dependent alcohol dehydrogenase [Pelagibacterium halotolerans]SDZ82260.1 NADPH:quinone reductase [Pelagibacterium halotolerans]